MEIAHCLYSIDKNAGGTATYMQLLANSLSNKINLSIFTISSDDPLNFKPGVRIITTKNSLNQIIEGYFFHETFKNEKYKPDIIHANGVWQLPVHTACKYARNNKIPYILSPHGMLEPWALEQGNFKKKIALKIYQLKDLENAFCLHATSIMEAESIRKLGVLKPIAIIPNGIHLPDFSILEKKDTNSRKTILFLSRLHPKKGIEILIEAWSKMKEEIKINWKIEIAGNGETNYIKTLQSLINNKKLENEIKIIGPQFGLDKISTYQRADIFVLPTFSENFGIVITEALACGIPVITTKGAPWEDLNKFKAGWWIDIGVEPLIKCFQEVLNLPSNKLTEIGNNGRMLVEAKYNIDIVSKQMIELYDWVLGKTEKPSFVKLD